MNCGYDTGQGGLEFSRGSFLGLGIIDTDFGYFLTVHLFVLFYLAALNVRRERQIYSP